MSPLGARNMAKLEINSAISSKLKSFSPYVKDPNLSRSILHSPRVKVHSLEIEYYVSHDKFLFNDRQIEGFKQQQL